MIISPLQKFEPKDWQGLTTENHLGSLYALEPLVIDKLIEHIYKVNLGDDILSYLNKFPTVEIDDDRPYHWFLQGADEKNVPLVRAEDSAGNLAGSAAFLEPGLGNTRFFMVFPEKYFVETDVIVGEKPDLYKLRVVDVVMDGTDFKYEVELVTGDSALFVQPADLAAQTRWSVEYSLVEQTLSKRGGTVRHTSPFRMENVMSMIRKEYTVPGNMIRKGTNSPNAFAWKDQNGNVQTTWLGKLDWDFMTQFRREQAKLCLFGNSNRATDGTYGNMGDSGYEIRAGAGLREQIAPSNIFFYNNFVVDWLTEVALGLTVGKVPEDSREFVLGTGEYGMFQFHKAVEEKGSAFTPNFTQDRIQVDKASGKMRYQGQFLEYRAVNGIMFKLMHIPQYDDPIRNKLLHPDGGLAESRRYTIMDFGTASGEYNIQKVALKGESEAYRYIPGLRDPYTPGGKGTPQMAASSVDGYEVHRAFIGGVRVKNPMRMAEYIPNILA